MAAPVSASELSKLVTTAAECAKAAEDADKAQQGRCLDVLKHMQKLSVTAAVLKETDAGKKVNKLTKSPIAEIAAAAAKVVQSWKECVKQQAQEAGGTLQTSTSQPDFGSQLSLGTSTSLGTSAKQATNGDAASRPSLPKQPAPQLPPQPKRPIASTGTKKGLVCWYHVEVALAPCSASFCNMQHTRRHAELKQCVSVSCLYCSHDIAIGDPKRDKIRKLFCDGLSLVPDDQRQGQDPAEVAAAVEAALFSKYGGQTGAEYSSKVRTLSFNFKDPNNPNLRARVVTRAVDPQVRQLPHAPVHDDPGLLKAEICLQVCSFVQLAPAAVHFQHKRLQC